MRFNGFDLNQAVCLEALLLERSVSRAAARVHLSQSAMSWVLAQQREYFQDPLLVRSGRKMVLTPFAQTLLTPITEFLTQAHALTAMTPKQAPTEVQRELRIAASDYSVSAFLASAIQQLAEPMPGLRFDIVPLSDNSVAALQSGEIDLITAGQAMDVGLPPNELLFEDMFVCVVCENCGTKARRMTEKRYMESDHVVMRYFEHRMSFEDEEALRRHGVKRRRRVAVSSVMQIAPIITGTTLVGTVPKRIADSLVERWPLRMLSFPFEQETIRHYAYWHDSRDDDPALTALLDVIRNTVH